LIPDVIEAIKTERRQASQQRSSREWEDQQGRIGTLQSSEPRCEYLMLLTT
jgi:hypothetical protein